MKSNQKIFKGSKQNCKLFKIPLIFSKGRLKY